MKTTYVDAATGERHLLVRTASSAVAMREAVAEAMGADILLMLRNQQVIMQRLEAGTTGDALKALKRQQDETSRRLAGKPPANSKAAA